MVSKKKADDSQASGSKPKTRRPAAPRDGGKPRAGAREAATAVAEASSPSAAPAAPSGKVVVERQIGGRTLTLETGRMAKLSDGACVARYGDTMVLATVNSQKAPEGIDFFPLTVDYREKTSAAGVIPGGFFKREGRPSTKEILACRIIDRSIRPMFPDGFKREVQVLSQVLSTDRENDPDVLAAIASFAALALSSLPHGPSLGMVRIGCIDDKLSINPLWTELQSEANQLNLTVAGHDEAIVMVEAGAKQVSEELMLQALELAHETCRTIAGMVEELAAKAGKPKMAFTAPQPDQELVAAIEDEFGEDLRRAPLTPGTKQVRSAATKAAKERATKRFHAPSGATPEEQKVWNSKVAEILGNIIKDSERQSILRGRRADGRDHKTVRPITIEVGVLPRVHGSVLFTRGETQALGVVTLGGTDDQQIIDGLMPEPRKRFLLHYNFPPFSVGEVKRVGTPGRREIGHGALAERGLEAVLPPREVFPYTIRITSEILESNGSSSMATACSGTLAMMDAGVPIKQPVAGIAMGLVMEGKKYAILTDILGSEDACGDMDFKVVGTGKGITALQMDIKCEGLTREIMKEALEQAKEGRLHVLREMLKALNKPRAELSPNAPRLESVQIPSEKIGLIIGPGGKNIRAMQENFECKISIEDGGLCTVTGINAEKVKACVEHIRSMTAEVELGAIYEGRVTAIKEFGAFVEILPSQEGLVHVSELSDGFIRAVTDVVRIGDTLKVKVIAIDDFGKVKLSRKAVLLAERGATGGAVPPATGDAAAPARPDRPARPDGDRPERGPRPDGDRPERGPRGEFGDRAERGPRPDGDRPERGPRGEFGDRAERGPRPDGDRPERGPRGEFGDRAERGPRPDGDRPERGPRGEFGDRAERGPRPDGDRPERGPRGEFGDRAERGPRPDGDRPERGPRGEFGDRAERGPRPDGDRPERGPRGEFGDRAERGPRPDGDRPERGPRGEFGDRAERGPRPDGDRPDRGPRAEHGNRPERGPRPDGDRPERGPRPDGDRPDRAPRGEFGDRPERGPRPDGDRPERGPRGDGNRPERGPRPDGDRPDRAPRGEFGDRPDRGPRPDGDRPERGPRGDGDRPERGPRPDGDRAERGPRGEWSDRPERPRQDRGEERPFRGERDDRRPAPGAREERGPRADAPPAGDRPERADRPARPEPRGADRGERSAPPAGGRFERRPERGPRADGDDANEGPGAGWRARRDEPADRGERRPARDAAAPRDAGAPAFGGPARPARPERTDRPDRPARPERTDRPERSERPAPDDRRPRGEEGPRGADRGGRADRGFRSGMPMAEFEDDTREPVTPPEGVGQLESLDSVLGDDPRGPRRDRGRRRRD